MPDPLLDVSTIDLNKTLMGRAEIDEYLPQRYEFQQVDRIVLIDETAQICAGVQEITAEKFWAKGHFPGNPVMPGVMQCETAAQIVCIANKIFCKMDKSSLVGFAGLEEVRFRGMVKPGDKFLVVAKALRASPRMAKYQCQGFVDGKMVFEGIVLGIPLPSPVK